MKLNKQGYWHDKNLGLIHRRVYTVAHGKIPKNWIVHHLDENKTNNSLDNLIAMPWHCHDQLHAHQKKIGRRLSRVETETFIGIHLDNTKLLQRRRTGLELELKKLNEEIKKRTSMHFKFRSK